MRGASCLLILLSMLYLGFATMRSPGIPNVGWEYHGSDRFEMVGDTELPDFPTPVIVTDRRGRAKWTISIPPGLPFPLAPKQYVEMCQQAHEVSQSVEDLHAHLHRTHAAHYAYYRVDPNFIDVNEAEKLALLPSRAEESAEEVCERSMTVVLETSDAGMGRTLMMLWMAYGLAEKEGRHFFVDDLRWFVLGAFVHGLTDRGQGIREIHGFLSGASTTFLSSAPEP